MVGIGNSTNCSLKNNTEQRHFIRKKLVGHKLYRTILITLVILLAIFILGNVAYVVYHEYKFDSIMIAATDASVTI